MIDSLWRASRSASRTMVLGLTVAMQLMSCPAASRSSV
jgi:hypothetical protein